MRYSFWGLASVLAVTIMSALGSNPALTQVFQTASISISTVTVSTTYATSTATLTEPISFQLGYYGESVQLVPGGGTAFLKPQFGWSQFVSFEANGGDTIFLSLNATKWPIAFMVVSSANYDKWVAAKWPPLSRTP